MSRSNFGGPCHQWFAAQVWSGREDASATHLRLRGYEVFLPCHLERRRWSDRIKKVNRPLFPGYVFCRVREDVAGNCVMAPGVIRIVGNGQHPIAIPDEEIETIERIVATGLDAQPWPFLQGGQRVTIERGPLSGTQGLVVRARGSHRLVVSVHLLLRSVAVEIDADWVSVSPVDPPSEAGDTPLG